MSIFNFDADEMFSEEWLSADINSVFDFTWPGPDFMEDVGQAVEAVHPEKVLDYMPVPEMPQVITQVHDLASQHTIPESKPGSNEEYTLLELGPWGNTGNLAKPEPQQMPQQQPELPQQQLQLPKEELILEPANVNVSLKLPENEGFTAALMVTNSENSSDYMVIPIRYYDHLEQEPCYEVDLSEYPIASIPEEPPVPKVDTEGTNCTASASLMDLPNAVSVINFASKSRAQPPAETVTKPNHVFEAFTFSAAVSDSTKAVKSPVKDRKKRVRAKKPVTPKKEKKPVAPKKAKKQNRPTKTVTKSNAEPAVHKLSDASSTTTKAGKSPGRKKQVRAKKPVTPKKEKIPNRKSSKPGKAHPYKFIPDELKDERYWTKRQANTNSTRKSRTTRDAQLKKDMETVSHLEAENVTLAETIEDIKKENEWMKLKMEFFVDPHLFSTDE